MTKAQAIRLEYQEGYYRYLGYRLLKASPENPRTKELKQLEDLFAIKFKVAVPATLAHSFPHAAVARRTYPPLLGFAVMALVLTFEKGYTLEWFRGEQRGQGVYFSKEPLEQALVKHSKPQDTLILASPIPLGIPTLKHLQPSESPYYHHILKRFSRPDLTQLIHHICQLNLSDQPRERYETIYHSIKEHNLPFYLKHPSKA